MTSIVIAEDEAIIRLDLRELLEEEGYVVVGEAGRGDLAVTLVRELKPDVVILDVKMPGLDGIEAVALPRQAQMPTKHAARRNVDDRQQPDPLHLHHVLPTQRVPFKNDFESQVELVGIKLDRVVCTQGGTLDVP